MKTMFTDLVDQVMAEQIKVLNSDSVAIVMEQKIPILTKELRNVPQNPPKIKTYTQITDHKINYSIFVKLKKNIYKTE